MAVEVVLTSDDPDPDRLAIRVLGRTHTATDYWDGNWVTCTIEARIGRFVATVGADLRTDELVAFRDQLEVVFQQLDGTARLDSMEHWVEIEVRAQSRGHLRVDGVLRDRAGGGNELRFTFGTEQTYLQETLVGLRRVVAAFPVVGRP